jgi:hypothetical protein
MGVALATYLCSMSPSDSGKHGVSDREEKWHFAIAFVEASAERI